MNLPKCIIYKRFIHIYASFGTVGVIYEYQSSAGVVVKLLALGARDSGFDSRSCRYDFRNWLSPASKSQYGWNILKTTIQPTIRQTDGQSYPIYPWMIRIIMSLCYLEHATKPNRIFRSVRTQKISYFYLLYRFSILHWTLVRWAMARLEYRSPTTGALATPIDRCKQGP